MTCRSLIDYSILFEQATGDKFSEEQRAVIAQGASERDLVNSGLEETMVNAYHSMNTVRHDKKIKSLRTAGFILALDRIAVSYLDLGIFPQV